MIIVDHEKLRNVASWLDGGEKSIMLITSSLHHEDLDLDYCSEAAELTAGMSQWDMLMAMNWLARIASESLAAQAGSRGDALADVQALAIAFHSARSAGAGVTDVGR